MTSEAWSGVLVAVGGVPDGGAAAVGLCTVSVSIVVVSIVVGRASLSEGSPVGSGSDGWAWHEQPVWEAVALVGRRLLGEGGGRGTTSLRQLDREERAPW